MNNGDADLFADAQADLGMLFVHIINSSFYLERLNYVIIEQGPVVQSVVSLTSSLRVISLTVLADSIHNILIFFAEKM